MTFINVKRQAGETQSSVLSKIKQLSIQIWITLALHAAPSFCMPFPVLHHFLTLSAYYFSLLHLLMLPGHSRKHSQLTPCLCLLDCLSPLSAFTPTNPPFTSISVYRFHICPFSNSNSRFFIKYSYDNSFI